MVALDQKANPVDFSEGDRVGVKGDIQGHEIVIALPPRIDPSVSMMQV